METEAKQELDRLQAIYDANKALDTDSMTTSECLALYREQNQLYLEISKIQDQRLKEWGA